MIGERLRRVLLAGFPPQSLRDGVGMSGWLV